MNIRIIKLIIKFFAVFQFCLPLINTSAQSTSNAINYQAVVRNTSGYVEENQPIVVQFTILAGEVNGNVVWREEHTTQTNKFGLFTLNIGKGSRKEGVGKFSDINWGANLHFLKVEAKIGTSKDYMFLGTTQMLAVPYALYADKAGTATPDFTKFSFDANSNVLKNDGATIADLTPLRQNLEYDPTSYHLSISGKPGIVDLRQFAHAPQDLRILNNKIWITGNKDSTVVDLSPYKQTLQINSTSKLQISGGNEVQVDTSNVNEIQTLSLNSNKLSLSKSAGEVTIDASATNELQTLSKVGNALVLSNAPNGRAIPIDTSLNNEIQDISLTGNSLKISGSSTPVDLTKYLDDTDKQTLDRSGSNLIISGGNQIDVSDMINPPFIGFSGNNVSNQALPGLAETLITWSEEFDSGNVLDNNRFIVPVNGIYNLSFSLIFTTTNFTIRIYKNSNPIPIRSFEGFGLSFSHTMLLSLQQNDNIFIKVYSSFGSSLPLGSSYFSGFKVN